MTGIFLKDFRSFIQTKKSGELHIWEMHEGVVTLIHSVVVVFVTSLLLGPQPIIVY